MNSSPTRYAKTEALRRLGGILLGACAVFGSNVSIAQPGSTCPWLIREVSPVPELVAVSADVAPGDRIFSLTYFGATRAATAFYGFGLQTQQRLSDQLVDFSPFVGAGPRGLRCKIVDDDGAEHAYCAFRRTGVDVAESTLYLVAAAGRIAELEQIRTRIDPVRLDVRGPTDFSGRLPRQLTLVESLAGVHQASASQFQVCAFDLN